MNDDTRSAKCQGCGGIYLQAELSGDGRCQKCVNAGKLTRQDWLRCLHDARVHAGEVVDRAIRAHPELEVLRNSWHTVCLGEESGGAVRTTGDWPAELAHARIVVVNDPALRRELEAAILPYHRLRFAALDTGVALD